MIIAAVSPESLENDTLFSNNPLLDRLFSVFLFVMYMSIVEGIFKGRTLGKMITGTKAVNADGSTISFSTALGRGFSRIVPFEPFSALGNPPYHGTINGPTRTLLMLGIQGLNIKTTYFCGTVHLLHTRHG
jgi:uncharacterized RDD family membrane protein YckC